MTLVQSPFCYLVESTHSDNLKLKVFELSNRLQVQAKETGVEKGPGKHWIAHFLSRHPEIKLGRPTGLDPKCATMFNVTTVMHHFTLLSNFIQENSIPWSNIYNMDEKGIQLGGGRKGDNMKFFFSRSQKAHVQVTNGNLELVTVIESICADGSSIQPGFVFSGTEFCLEWFHEDNIL